MKAENSTVFTIKAIHLFLFVLMIVSLFYALYCAIVGVFNWWLLAAMLMILFDGVSIALNRGRCPLTTLAERHRAVDGAITHLIKFFIALFIVELIWLGIGYFG
jgi:hypothetical protein